MASAESNWILCFQTPATPPGFAAPSTAGCGENGHHPYSSQPVSAKSKGGMKLTTLHKYKFEVFVLYFHFLLLLHYISEETHHFLLHYICLTALVTLLYFILENY